MFKTEQIAMCKSAIAHAASYADYTADHALCRMRETGLTGHYWIVYDHARRPHHQGQVGQEQVTA